MAGIDTYTKLCLHCDGSDGSTTFIDSATGKTVYEQADAQIDTDQSVFGGASCILDGTGDYLAFNDHADWAWGSGDFCVDFRVRFSDISADRGFFGQYTSSSSYFGAYWDQSAGALTFEAVAIVPIITVTGSFSPSVDTWYHIALTRSGNDYLWFVDGTSCSMGGTPDSSSVPNLVTDTFDVGRLNTAYMQGWLDEFRVSVGTPRWTSNFTPPSDPYCGPMPPQQFRRKAFPANRVPPHVQVW